MAIRNYELSNRSQNKDQLIALGCYISALIDHEPNSKFEIMHLLFDYEEQLKFRPVIENSNISLMSNDTNFNDFLVEWDEM